MRAMKWIAGLLFPRRAVCMGCGDMTGCDRDDICEDCRRAMADGWVGVRPAAKRSFIDGAAFAYRYRGPAGGVVRSLKYGSVWLLAEEMGRDVARAAEMLKITDLNVVTAVPMHPKRLRARDRNHSELIARSAAQRLGVSYGELLARTRNAPQQARLSNAERRRNLKGGFAALPDGAEAIRGRTVLLIDDVWTTGATAESCAEALKAAGAAHVYFAAYAYGEKKNGKNKQR